MSSSSEIFCVGGWGQRADVFSKLEEHLQGISSCRNTSVYELAESFLAREEGLEEAFAPVSPSIYARELSSMLNPEEPSVLVAWSMGGLVSLETAYFFPERVSKLILLASTACFCSKEDEIENYRIGVLPLKLRGMAIGMRKAPRLTLVMFFRNVYPVDFDTGIFEEKVEQAVALDRAILQHGLKYLEKTDLRAVLASIEQESLVLHGQEDKVIDVDAGEYLALHLPRSSFVGIENASHALVEQCPGRVAAEIKSFLGH